MLMKRISTLFLVLFALLSLPLAVSAEEFTFDFENNLNNWPVGEGVNFADGNLTNPLTVGEVTLTNVQGDATQPARLMKDNSGVTALYVYKNGSIKFNAAEGRALVKIDVTMKSGSFDLTASNGAVAANAWTGNATEVLFTASATRQMKKIVVTTAAENGETVKPAAETFDVEAANIAAFNAVEDGKTVKLALSNARVNGVKGGSYYVEDATGATVIKGITLTAGTALNGYIIGAKSTDNTIDYMNEPAVAVEYQLTATDASTFEATATTLVGTVMTGAEAAAQANYGRLIALENVAISGTGQNKTLTVGGTALSIRARDYMGVLPAGYTWPEKASKLTGVVVYYMTSWFIMPISADAIVATGAQPTSVTFDFTTDALHAVGTNINDKAGWILNDEFLVDNVLLQITAGSAPSRIFKDTNRGNCLSMYKEYATLTFTAPAGYAIVKIDFTYAGTGTLNFTATPAGLEGNTWTGNAEGVRFLNNATPYLANAVVTLAPKNDATVAFPAINYTECANIAAFNALENGAYAKVMLTDAEITGISADGYSTIWLQDATGGCWMQYTTLIEKYLQEGNKVNGFFYVVKRVASGNPQMKETEDTPKSEFTQTPFGEPAIIEGTLAEVNVAANLNKVVKISGANLAETSATAGTLTQGDATIAVNNGTATANQQLHKIAEWAKDTNLENIDMVAILVAKSTTENQLLPISITTGGTGIAEVNAANAEHVVIYNLQGVRQSRLQKGINIVNGKKVIIK